MIPIDQGDGNCFQACIASIFEVPIEKIPDCTISHKWDWDAFQYWLFERNWIAVEVEKVTWIPPNCYCILSGVSPRGDDLQHAVVGMSRRIGFDIVHDPYHTREGLVSLKSITFFAWSGHEECRRL